MQLFDTHCHLDLPALAGDLSQHLSQAAQVGVAKMLVPAVESARWPLLRQLSAQQPHLYFAFGIHPWWVEGAALADLDSLSDYLALPNCCACGELGLDFALDWHREPATLQQRQIEFFRAQVAIAAQWKKPLILHHRKSQAELLIQLKAARFNEGGILHAFSGSQAQAQAFLDLGFKLGIGGTITYERSVKTRHAVAKLPLDSLVLETDAPSMPLAGFQGQVNTPSQLPLVLAALASLKNKSINDIWPQLWANSHQVLRLNPTRV